MHELKLQSKKQWNADPCGASNAPQLAEGSLEFFDAIKSHRYGDFAPWMGDVMGFERFCGMKVLEIGPGLGTDLLRFTLHGARCYAIDLVERHLRLTRKNLELRGYDVPCLLGDGEFLPFKTGVFDCIYAFGVLHHTPNPELAVAEIHRILKNGGKTIVALYHRDSAFYWVYTVLIRGIVLMGLWKKGYQRLMSEIESRSGNSDAMPLVKVYSRNEVHKMFREFRKIRLQTCHLEYSHFIPIRRVISMLPSSWQRREFVERFARYFGWFLIVEGEK